MDFRTESKSMLSSLVHLANFRFATMDNYFNAELNNPIIHLWSLSLEEQFYLVWPITLILWYRLSKNKNTLIFILFGLLVASFFLSHYTNSQENLRHFSYFILPTRMQGLLLGAMLACLLNRKYDSNLLFY